MNKYDEYPVRAITELLEQLCPDGVPTVTIGAHAKRNRATNITASKMADLNTPDGDTLVFAAGSTKARINAQDYPGTNVTTVPSVLVKSRGYVDFEYCDEPFTHKSELWSYHATSEELSIKYLFYTLSGQKDHFQEVARANAVKLPQLKVADTDSFEIPLPPLEVQEQIVAILDTFTELDASMNRELELREVQFAHQRELLLDFNKCQSKPHDPTYPVPSIVDSLEELCPEGVPMAPLRKVAQIHRGNRVTKAQLQIDGKYPVMSGGITPMGYLDRANQRANITTVVKYGSAGFVNFIPEEFWANDVCYCLEPLDGVTDRYLYHALKSRQNDLIELRTDAVPPHLPTEAINSFEIPLPPVEIQKAIVDTLDMFTDYTVNLRREIDLRRQQLEYYREQLLAFPVAE